MNPIGGFPNGYTENDYMGNRTAHLSKAQNPLQNYLNAWFPILNRYHQRVVYLDGFSGPGIYSGGEPGSPIIALKTASQHFRPIRGEAVFIFVDEHPERVNNLQAEVQKLSLPSNYRVMCEHGEFEAVAGKILDELDKENRSLAPTFTFVDPFGFSGLPFHLMKRLLRHDRSEAFITFMVDAINRFLTAPNDELKKHLARLFGTDEVFAVASRPGDRVKNLTQLYQNQLRSARRFVRNFEMSDRIGKIIYHLLFVTNHSLGNSKMKEAMWQVDSEGEFRFSDATDPLQETLFSKDHTKELFDILETSFKGRTVDVADLRQFVQDQTPYIDKHLGGGLKHGESAKLITVNENKKDGTKRRQNTFPDGTIISFP